MIPIARPQIGTDEINAVTQVLASGMLAQGPKVKEFEGKFAELCGTKYAIATNSGTSALHTALYAMGIKAGDEVITTPFTFVASANCIVMQNAKPIFVDIKEDTFNIDPEKIEGKITKKTKAIIPVDIFGQIFDYEKIKSISEKHDLRILEDAAQSICAELNGKKAGQCGDAAAFSFYATKNIMCGEGGMIATNDEDIMEKAKRFRHHGQSEQTRYEYYDLGYNYRMTDMQAAIGIEQLKKVDMFTKKRIENAMVLTEGLGKFDVIQVPKVKPGAKHVFHQYTIRVQENKRDEIMNKLKEKGVGCAVFYPKPLHLHPFFRKMGYKEGDLPVAEKIAKEVISLPIHPGVTLEDVKSIIKIFEEIL